MVGNWIFPHPSDERPQVFEEKIDYKFTDHGNRMVALIGDKFIDLVIVTTGRKNNKTRSEINDMIQQRACNAHLSKQGFDLGIDQFIVKNPIQLDIENRLMAITMEATIGAVHLDCNGQISLCAGAMAALGISWP
ncbi:hypothetical protein LT330_009379 [Penicillium expansum]|nr:hypothetical protein LT330_009379 [Penicillium expansum]